MHGPPRPWPAWSWIPEAPPISTTVSDTTLPPQMALCKGCHLLSYKNQNVPEWETKSTLEGVLQRMVTFGPLHALRPGSHRTDLHFKSVREMDAGLHISVWLLTGTGLVWGFLKCFGTEEQLGRFGEDGDLKHSAGLGQRRLTTVCLFVFSDNLFFIHSTSQLQSPFLLFSQSHPYKSLPPLYPHLLL